MAVFTAIAALATLIVLAIPPQYRSEAKVLVLSQQIRKELVPKPISVLADERIQITRTRITARDQLLTIAEKYALFPKKRKDLSTSALVDLLKKRITIEPFELTANRRQSDSEMSIAFKVGFDYEVPDTASKVANELVTLILDADINSQVQTASETVKFLERETNKLQLDLAKIDETLTAFKQQNRDSLPERVPFQLASLERLEKSDKDTELELYKLSEQRRIVLFESKLLGSVGSGNNSTDLTNPKTLSIQLENLKTEFAQKSATLSDSHPDIKILISQIKRIEDRLKQEEAETIKVGTATAQEQKKLFESDPITAEKVAGIDRQVEVFKKQRVELRDAVNAINKALSQAPEVQNKLVLMDRQREGTQKGLEEIRSKLTEAERGLSLIKTQQAERFEVIEQPIVPQEPSWPNIPKYLALGIGLAGMAGSGTVAGLEFINRSIRSSTDIVRAVNRHPIVVIPYIQTKEETRRRLRKLIMIVAGLALAVLLGLLAVNLFFMPLDVLWSKVMIRVGL